MQSASNIPIFKAFSQYFKLLYCMISVCFHDKILSVTNIVDPPILRLSPLSITGRVVGWESSHTSSIVSYQKQPLLHFPTGFPSMTNCGYYPTISFFIYSYVSCRNRDRILRHILHGFLCQKKPSLYILADLQEWRTENMVLIKTFLLVVSVEIKMNKRRTRYRRK